MLGQEASDIILPTTAPYDVASSRVSPLHPGLLGSKHNRWIAVGRRELCTAPSSKKLSTEWIYCTTFRMISG